jgi:hypothetical protein
MKCDSIMTLEFNEAYLCYCLNVRLIKLYYETISNISVYKIARTSQSGDINSSSSVLRCQIAPVLSTSMRRRSVFLTGFAKKRVVVSLVKCQKIFTLQLCKR